MSSVPGEPYFSLTYQHGVDDKRRLSIPAPWRDGWGESEVLFYVLLWDKGEQPACLLALPPELMRVLRDKLKGLSFADQESEALLRLLGQASARLTVDKAGRITLPEQLAKAAGIGDRAVLVGMMDRFQIWNPGSYEAAQAADQVLKGKAHKLI